MSKPWPSLNEPENNHLSKDTTDQVENRLERQDEQAAGFEILGNFRRFSRRNDVFSRSFWDPAIRSKKTERFYETYRQPLKQWRKVDGFAQKDYALRNAAWHVTDIFAEFKESEDRREGFLDEFTVQRDGPDVKLETASPEEMSAEIKQVARVFRANLVGITQLDVRWHYAHKYSAQTRSEKPNDLPAGLEYVIVVAQEMDYELIQTVPSALSGTATGLGYSKDVIVLLSIAQYIRNLGYQAVASLNDSALAVPYAIQAGLGEYGRHGLVITQEFGPRIRLSKIFTDLPLAHDRPTRFGCASFVRAAAAAPGHFRPKPSPVLAQPPKSTTSRILSACVNGVSMARSALVSGLTRTAIALSAFGSVPTIRITHNGFIAWHAGWPARGCEG